MSINPNISELLFNFARFKDQIALISSKEKKRKKSISFIRNKAHPNLFYRAHLTLILE